MCCCNCEYEDYFGDCQKPSGLPCPMDEDDAYAFAEAESMDAGMERHFAEKYGDPY